MSVLVDNIFVRKIVSVLADNDDFFGQCWQKLSVMVHIKITLVIIVNLSPIFCKAGLSCPYSHKANPILNIVSLFLSMTLQ